jgi:hypothetical protein
MSTQGTDAREMVNHLKVNSAQQNSFGCNTDGIKTTDKMIGAIMKTTECGSQALTHTKEVKCNTEVFMESQACQKNMESNDKEATCMILRPEDLLIKEAEANNWSELPDCFRCDGTKVNKKGLPCKKCNATGKLNNKFFKDLQKILTQEVNKYCS